MKLNVVGVDIAKRVFQVHWVEQDSGEIVSVQLKREKFLEHFAKRVPCLIGMEACGGSQHWARELGKLGHEVKLLSARWVKPFVDGNKNDAADARAIWTAVQQPGLKTVAVKSEAQQAALAIDTLREQFARIQKLEEQILQIEQRLRQWHRDDPASQRIAAVPGVGLLTATAAVATMGDAKAFKSGREFAAWLGLVPRQSGTGGRVRLLGISKRGDTYLRTLLIHGARSVLTQSKDPPAWATNLAQRRPKNVTAVALANKMARTIWALSAHKRAYQPGYVSQPTLG
jgi:transposase